MGAYADDPCLLAGGSEGPASLRPLTATVLDALAAGAAKRGGPLPRGGPLGVAARVGSVLDDSGRGGGVIPERGTGAREALRTLVGLVAEGAADPADPLCAAHLHCPPLAVSVAADLAASALNPSLDSWDQAPAASELEARVCRALGDLVYGGVAERSGAAGGGGNGSPDALVTTGATESNLLGVLLAREVCGGGLRVVCGANAHHSVHRAAWMLGLAAPLVVPTPEGVLTPGALRSALGRADRSGAGAGSRPTLVVATAGTTDTGAVDPLGGLADVAAEFGARVHVDAAYGGALLFSSRLRHRLAGVERAHSVALDLHKLGWQPVAAGIFAVPERSALGPLTLRAEYLNAGDDTEAGLPDLLGRSLRTTRRPDVLKVAVTLRAVGRAGLAALVERACELAGRFADRVAADGRFELFGPPALSTVLFRPAGAGDEVVARVRRRLLAEGRAVVGRARVGGGAEGGGHAGGVGHPGAGADGGADGADQAGSTGQADGADQAGGTAGQLWLKVTLLNPRTELDDLAVLLERVHEAVGVRGLRPPPPSARPSPPPEPVPASSLLSAAASLRGGL